MMGNIGRGGEAHISSLWQVHLAIAWACITFSGAVELLLIDLMKIYTSLGEGCVEGGEH